MEDGFRYQGYWWLPGAGEHSVPGIVKFDPDEGTNLDLMGSLKGLEGIVEPIEPEIPGPRVPNGHTSCGSACRMAAPRANGQ